MRVNLPLRYVVFLSLATLFAMAFASFFIKEELKVEAQHAAEGLVPESLNNVGGQFEPQQSKVTVYQYISEASLSPAQAPRNSLDIKAERLYEDARVTLLCGRWNSFVATRKLANTTDTTAIGLKSEGSEDAFENTGADVVCPARGDPDIAQAEMQIEEAARLNSEDAKYIVAEAAFKKASESRIDGFVRQEDKDLVREAQRLAMNGNKQAAFLMSDIMRSGLVEPADTTRAAAWGMVAIQPPGSQFRVELVENYRQYAEADSPAKDQMLAAAMIIYKQCCWRD